jgi:hypothetical protein
VLKRFAGSHVVDPIAKPQAICLMMAPDMQMESSCDSGPESQP